MIPLTKCWQVCIATGTMTNFDTSCFRKKGFRCTYQKVYLKKILCYSQFYGFLFSGTIRNLSPQLWDLHHLTSLYLNDNNLSRLPPEISKMHHLMYLDLSSNKLRSLPAELGDMVHLRELLLNNNYLRVLPYELGRLFQLQTLGESVASDLAF